MKTILSILLLTFTFQGANAESVLDVNLLPEGVYAAQLDKLEMSVEHGGNEFERAFVYVDYDNLEVQLHLEYIQCPDGQYCLTYYKLPKIIKLPITNYYSDFCNVFTIVAHVDDTPFDGLLSKIQIMDYSEMRCKIKIDAYTSLQYSTYNPWTDKTQYSNLSSWKKLERIYLP